MKRYAKELGDAGEDAATAYFQNLGYKILAKNFRYSRIAEIDFIAEMNSIIVFVEVKTRSSNQYGSPAEAVDFRKQQKIIMAATKFLQDNDFFDCACRFDVVEVFVDKNFATYTINHIENAFEVS